MWPSVALGKSFVGVAGSKNGKTTGYLIPIVNHILTKGDETTDYPYPHLGECGEAPLAIIVAPTWKKAVAISETLDEIVRKAGAIVPTNGQYLKALLVFEKETVARVPLMNGCHILVTTPPSLLRLLCDLKSTRMSNCCHLIFDDADVTFENYHEEVGRLMDIFDAEHARRSARDAPMLKQIVVASSSWSEPVRQFVETYLKPKNVRGCSVGISSPLDSALYGKVKTVPHFFAAASEKVSAIPAILEGCSSRSKKHRCLILCRDQASVTAVAECLNDSGIKDIFAIHEGFENRHLQAKRTLEKWNANLAKKSEGNVCTPLILSDSALLEFTEANTIIHYDLPTASKKMFGMRYWHLSANFSGIYDGSYEEREQCESHILISPEDRRALRTLFPFLRADPNAEIPLAMKKYYLESMLSSAEEKKEAAVAICQSVKVMGKCQKLRTCSKRHFFDRDADYSGSTAANLITSGVVTFRVTEVLEPVHFVAKVEYLANKGDKVDFKKMGSRLAFELFRLKSKERELKPVAISVALGDALNAKKIISAKSSTTTSEESAEDVQPPKPREQQHVGLPLYLAKGGADGGFKRVEIVASYHEDETWTLQVFYVDEGFHEWRRGVRLFALPDKLKEYEFPRQSVEIILAGLKPKDKDIEWSNSAMRFSREQMAVSDADESAKLFTAKIWMGLRNTIWVRRIHRLNEVRVSKEVCDDIGKKVVRSVAIAELRRRMLENMLVDENPRHLDILMDLCHRAGMAKEEEAEDDEEEGKEDKVDEVKSPPAPERWAFLEADSQNDVVVTEVYSPDRLYVRRLKFSSQLKQLEKELEQYAANEKSLGNIEPGEGEICAGKLVEEDGSSYWARVKIMRELHEEGGSAYRVMCVDYGTTETVDTILPISPDLVAKLPFQAIECKLFNVEPVGGEWPKEAGDLVFEAAGDEDGAEASLTAIVLDKGISECTGMIKQAYSNFQHGETGFSPFLCRKYTLQDLVGNGVWNAH